MRYSSTICPPSRRTALQIAKSWGGYPRNVTADSRLRAPKTHSILGAHGFNSDRIDPSFPTVVRSFKDAEKAVSLQVVKTSAGNRGTFRDFIKYLTILGPGYTRIPLSVPASNHRRLICGGLEAPPFSCRDCRRDRSPPTPPHHPNHHFCQRASERDQPETGNLAGHFCVARNPPLQFGSQATVLGFIVWRRGRCRTTGASPGVRSTAVTETGAACRMKGV